MCGRYTLTSYDNLMIEFGLSAPPLPGPARFNIAPTQFVPIVPNREERTLTLARWGLVPSWAKDPAIGNRMINARVESAADKPAFRTALRRRRCLIVADGFYEWQRPQPGAGKAGRKIPYYVRRKGHRPFGMAGLWERWQAPDGSELETCTILTTEANELMTPIHARMPIILLDRAAHDRWLSPEPARPEDLGDLLRPPPADAFEAYPVSTLVNSPQHDDPACIEPAAEQAAAEPDQELTRSETPATPARKPAGTQPRKPAAARKPSAQRSLFDPES